MPNPEETQLVVMIRQTCGNLGAIATGLGWSRVRVYTAIGEWNLWDAVTRARTVQCHSR